MEQGSSKKNNIIVLCVVIAVIAVALVAYFVISGQKDNGQPAVSATMELNTVNIYGAWYKKAGDSTYELRFKDNKELSYKQTAADGTVTAQSDEGTYDIADGKLILTIVAGGQTYSDTCTANVNEKQMSIVADANGSGLFNGIYDKDGADYSVPDVSQNEPSEATDTTTTPPQTTAVTTAAPETTTATAPVTEVPESKPAVNGKIELPESIAKYFNTDYKDSEFNGLYLEDEKAGYVGYAGYYTDDKEVLYQCKYDKSGYGQGKALKVVCEAKELFPMFDADKSKYSDLTAYMMNNFGDKCKTSNDTGDVYFYQDLNYVILLYVVETDEVDPLISNISVTVCDINDYYRQRQ